MNLKGAIAVVAVLILIVFGILAVVLLVNPKDSRSGRSGNVVVHYNNGLADNKAREIKRSVPTYKVDGKDVPETRDNQTKLLTLKQSGFTNEGWTFNGWRLGFNAEIGDTIKGNHVPGGLNKDSGIITLVADWKANEYVISFNPDYPGTGFLAGPDPITVTTGEDINGLYDGIFVPDAFEMGELVFKGWRTQPNGKGKLVEEGSENKFTAHTMLYGWWINPADKAYQRTVTVASQVIGGGTGPFYTFRETHQQGTNLEFRLTDSGWGYNEFTGFTFNYFQVGTKKYYPSEFGSKLVLPLNNNFVITAYYTTSGGGTVAPGTNYTVTVQSQTVGGAAGPFATFSQTHASGTNLEFRLTDGGFGYNEFTGFTFAYFKVGTTTYYPSTFGTTLTLPLNANFTIIAFYNTSGGGTNPPPAGYVTLTVRSDIVNNVHNEEGPFYTFTQQYEVGTVLEFWLIDDGWGWDEFEWYPFSHFSIGSTNYHPGQANFTGGKFIYTITSNTTLTAWYF